MPHRTAPYGAQRTLLQRRGDRQQRPRRKPHGVGHDEGARRRRRVERPAQSRRDDHRVIPHVADLQHGVQTTGADPCRRPAAAAAAGPPELARERPRFRLDTREDEEAAQGWASAFCCSFRFSQAAYELPAAVSLPVNRIVRIAA